MLSFSLRKTSDFRSGTSAHDILKVHSFQGQASSRKEAFKSPPPKTETTTQVDADCVRASACRPSKFVAVATLRSSGSHFCFGVEPWRACGPLAASIDTLQSIAYKASEEEDILRTQHARSMCAASSQTAGICSASKSANQFAASDGNLTHLVAVIIYLLLLRQTHNCIRSSPLAVSRNLLV